MVLDIEGTTTPASFVYDVLFPYAREHLRSYIEFHIGRQELDESVRLLKHEWEDDVNRGTNPPPGMKDLERDAALHCVVEYAAWLMKQDRKSPGLKLLQGLIWESGYADGSLHGDVYPDVPPALARWHDAGLSIAIYSSGSVLAQQLLFSTTAYGDLTQFIGHYFDTRVGPKREADSYHRIADELAAPATSLLFISDVTAELDAARDAGMHVLQCWRGGNVEVEESEFDVIETFDEVDS